MNGDTILILQEIREFRKDHTEHKNYVTKEFESIKIKLASADLTQMKKDVRSLMVFKTRAIAMFTVVQSTILIIIGYFKFNK